MKKIDFKSILIGFIIGTVGITTAFAANGIKSATLGNVKINLDGAAVPLNNPLVFIIKDNEQDAKLYMPMRELLEHLGYNVIWNGATDTVDLYSNVFTNVKAGIEMSCIKIYRSDETYAKKSNELPLLTIGDKEGIDLFVKLVNNAQRIQGELDASTPPYIAEVYYQDRVEILNLYINYSDETDNWSGMLISHSKSSDGHIFDSGDVKAFMNIYGEALKY